jgi:hypothetical protein
MYLLELKQLELAVSKAYKEWLDYRKSIGLRENDPKAKELEHQFRDAVNAYHFCSNELWAKQAGY